MPDGHAHGYQELIEAAERAAASGDLRRTEALFRDAVRLQEQELGPAHPGLASTCNNLAIVCERIGEVREAEYFYRRAHAIAASLLDAKDPFVQTSFENLREFCASHDLPLADWPDLETTHSRTLRTRPSGPRPHMARRPVPAAASAPPVPESAPVEPDGDVSNLFGVYAGDRHDEPPPVASSPTPGLSIPLVAAAPTPEDDGQDAVTDLFGAAPASPTQVAPALSTTPPTRPAVPSTGSIVAPAAAPARAKVPAGASAAPSSVASGSRSEWIGEAARNTIAALVVFGMIGVSLVSLWPSAELIEAVRVDEVADRSPAPPPSSDAPAQATTAPPRASVAAERPTEARRQPPSPAPAAAPPRAAPPPAGPRAVAPSPAASRATTAPVAAAPVPAAPVARAASATASATAAPPSRDPAPSPANTTGAATPATGRAAARVAAAGLRVVRAEVCSTFDTRARPWRCQPVEGDVAAGPLTYYTRITTAEAKTPVEHRWYRGDALALSRALSIAYSPTEGYRTYSRYTPAPGDWRVELVGPDGAVLHQARFTVK